MKKIIITFFCTVLFGYSLVSAMEIVPLLEKKSQQQVDSYFKERLPMVKLSKIGKYYGSIPIDCRGKIIQQMSPDLLMLHGIALCLPSDIQQHIINNVKYIMFNEDSKAFDIFYHKKPMLEAFQLYHTIKKSIREGESVACLYRMSDQRRNEILEKLNPWYSCYSHPIVTIQEQEKINKLNANARQYFIDKKMWLVPDSDLANNPCKASCVFAAQGACIYVSCNGAVLSVCGLSGGWNLMFMPATLAISSGIASVITSVFCLFGACCGVGGLLCNIKQVTLSE